MVLICNRVLDVIPREADFLLSHEFISPAAYKIDYGTSMAAIDSATNDWLPQWSKRACVADLDQL